MAVSVLAILLASCAIATASFDKEFDITWGDGRGKILNNGQLLTLGLAAALPHAAQPGKANASSWAVSAVRQLLASAARCPKDMALHDLWGGVGVMNRNLITGVVELNTAPPGTLRQMAALYDAPCEGAPVQPEAARSLRALSGGPRYMWIYVPG
jgi:hypothetical protein